MLQIHTSHFHALSSMKLIPCRNFKKSTPHCLKTSERLWSLASYLLIVQTISIQFTAAAACEFYVSYCAFIKLLPVANAGNIGIKARVGNISTLLQINAPRVSFSGFRESNEDLIYIRTGRRFWHKAGFYKFFVAKANSLLPKQPFRRKTTRVVVLCGFLTELEWKAFMVSELIITSIKSINFAARIWRKTYCYIN